MKKEDIEHETISFLNDYNEACVQEILDDLSEVRSIKFNGYSSDKLVEESKDLIKQHLNDEDVDIYYVHGGTMANIISLMLAMDRHQAVISASSGHIVNTENGSIEALGNQIIQVESHEGKVKVEDIEKILLSHSAEYNSHPSVIYISNATETGTVYKREELEELRNFCDEHDLYLFCDGARLATASISKNSDVSFDEFSKYFDIFTIGGTKNGFLFGEAIVVKNEKLKKQYTRMLIKQRGALLAKGFLYGAQFKTMFKGNLYFELAKHAVEMAEYMETKIGRNTKYPVDANLLFYDISEEEYKKIKDNFLFDAHKNEDSTYAVRLVTSWATTKDEIDQFVERLKS